MENDVQGDLAVRHLDGAQHLLGVVHVDVAHDGKSQEPHRLLTVYEQDHTGVPLALQLPYLPHPHRLEHALPQQRLQRR